MSPRKRKKIVIVDADAFLAGMYARRFERASWAVRVAETIEAARKLITDTEPDAVLIDIETDPSGVEFLREIRSNEQIEPYAVIVLTKLGDRESIDRAMQAGADSYLLKGHFVPSEVVEKVERLVS